MPCVIQKYQVQLAVADFPRPLGAVAGYEGSVRVEYPCLAVELPPPACEEGNRLLVALSLRRMGNGGQSQGGESEEFHVREAEEDV